MKPDRPRTTEIQHHCIAVYHVCKGKHVWANLVQLYLEPTQQVWPLHKTPRRWGITSGSFKDWSKNIERRMRSVSTSQSWTSALPHAPTVRRKQAGVHPNFPCNAQSAGKATETTKRSKVKRVLIHVELWKSLILINPTIIVQVDSNVIGNSQNAVEGTSLIIAGSVRKGLKLSKSQKKLQFFEMILEPLERPLSFGQRPQLPSAFILSTSSIFTEILAFISAYSDASHDSNFSKFHIIYLLTIWTHPFMISLNMTVGPSLAHWGNGSLLSEPVDHMTWHLLLITWQQIRWKETCMSTWYMPRSQKTLPLSKAHLPFSHQQSLLRLWNPRTWDKASCEQS